MESAEECLFHSFFNHFDFEDFVTRRTQQNDFEWLQLRHLPTVRSLSSLDCCEDARDLIESLQDGCLDCDEEPDETPEFFSLFREGESYFRKSSFELALRSYAAAQKLLPLISKTYQKLAVTFMKVDKPENAVACSLAAFMLCPHDAETEGLHALAYSQLGYADIGSKFINENSHSAESGFIKAVLKGIKPENKRRFDDQDLSSTLAKLINGNEINDNSALRCFFLLYHIRYHHWLRPKSKEISASLITFLSENALIRSICQSAVKNFTDLKHVEHCVLFVLFCLLAEICRDDETVTMKLWSSPAVQLFLSSIAVQIARDKVVSLAVEKMGIFGRSVIISFINLIAAMVKHANFRNVFCKTKPFDNVLWYGLIQVVYFSFANHELFRHRTAVEHKLPVLCFACAEGKVVNAKDLSLIEFLTEGYTVEPFDYMGKFFSLFPLLVENGEVVKSLGSFSLKSLEYTTHLFAILTSIGFYVELEDTRLTKKCALLTPFWAKITAFERVAQACGAEVWLFFTRKLSMYSHDIDAFKELRNDLALTLDVLLNLSCVNDFPDITYIDRALSCLADCLPYLIDSKIAPASTPALFVRDVSCKVLLLINRLCSKSEFFTKKLLYNRKFSLAHIILFATPVSQRDDSSPLCMRSLQLLTVLMKNSDITPVELLRLSDLVTTQISELAAWILKTKNVEFITSACLFMKCLIAAGKKHGGFVISGLKASSAITDRKSPFPIIGKLVALIDGPPKKISAKEHFILVMTVAQLLASLSEADASFRQAIVSDSCKLKAAVSRLNASMSKLSV